MGFKLVSKPVICTNHLKEGIFSTSYKFLCLTYIYMICYRQSLLWVPDGEDGFGQTQPYYIPHVMYLIVEPVCYVHSLHPPLPLTRKYGDSFIELLRLELLVNGPNADLSPLFYVGGLCILRHAESCVHRVVKQMIGWINMIYYNSIALISVMMWTASARYNLVFFLIAINIHLRGTHHLPPPSPAPMLTPITAAYGNIVLKELRHHQKTYCAARPRSSPKILWREGGMHIY